MKCRMLTTLRPAIMAFAVAVPTTSTATAGMQQSPPPAQIAPRNCATGEPVPAAAFEALYTFHADQTMLVSFRNNSLTLERTAAHGLWREHPAGRDYAFKFVHLRRNVSTGAFAGKQEGEGTLVLSESGDEFTTDGSSTIFDVNGNPGTPGCSSSAGIRFKFEP